MQGFGTLPDLMTSLDQAECFMSRVNVCYLAVIPLIEFDYILTNREAIFHQAFLNAFG